MNWEFCRSAREALSKHGEEGFGGKSEVVGTDFISEKHRTNQRHPATSSNQPQDGKRKAAEDNATGQVFQDGSRKRRKFRNVKMLR